MSTPKDGAKDFFRVFLSFILPPLAVLSQVGFRPHLILNLLIAAGQFAAIVVLLGADVVAFSEHQDGWRLLTEIGWDLLLVPVLLLPAVFHAIFVLATRDDHGKVVEGGFTTFVSLVIAVILPPVGVLLKRGFSGALAVNVVLWALGCVPGQIHAAWVITTDQ
jgi:uncharacterized membrane protein YqaE (UPF0057 family)